MKSWIVPSTALLSILGPATPLIAYSEVYLTPEQAAEILFPASKMKRSTLSIPKIDRPVHRWRDESGNVVYVDQVIGKHELITFAVGIDASSKIRGVEILEYREAYGHQIRGRSWRKQFVGKDHTDPITLNRDIQNISGATLSSLHVTDGIKKIVAAHELVKNRI